MVLKCLYCQVLRDANLKEPLKPYPSPLYPWQVIGSDIFRWQNNDYLLVVDYYSRYWEVVKLTRTTAEHIVEMKKMFSRFAIPKDVELDNGPQYVSQEFL